MRQAIRRRVLDEIQDDARHLLGDLDGLVTRIESAQAGQPTAAATEQTRTTGVTLVVDEDDEDQLVPSIVDPTGGAAVNRAMGGDRASRDLAELDKQLLAAARALDRVIRIARAYAPAHVAPPGPVRQATEAPPGCASCARLPGAHGGARWETVYARTTIDDGKKVPLCRWCYVWVTKQRKVTGQAQLPPRRELEWHHQGKTIRRPVR